MMVPTSLKPQLPSHLFSINMLYPKHFGLEQSVQWNPQNPTSVLIDYGASIETVNFINSPRPNPLS